MQHKKPNELRQVFEAREIVDPAVCGQRRRDGFTQRQAVAAVLDVFGVEGIDLADLRELASQEYGRRITLGVTLRCKLEYLGKCLKAAA